MPKKAPEKKIRNPEGQSPRYGLRTTKTKKKTAQALGRNFNPTAMSWRERHQARAY